jgi:hypothetical protein
LATTLTSHLAHQETDALLLIRTALTGAERKAVGWRIAATTGPCTGAEFFALMLDGLSRRCGCYGTAWKPWHGEVSP